MADVQNLLAQALGAIPASPDVNSPVGTSQQIMQNLVDASSAKQQSLSQVSDEKRNALGQNPNMYNVAAARESGDGLYSAQSDLERDLINLPDIDLIAKYGNDQGTQLIRSRAAGQANFNNDITAPRTTGQALGDTAAGVILGLGNSIGGIAALGAGLVNDDAGVWAADKMDTFNKGIQQNIQSDALNARRQANQAQTELGYRDSTKQYNEEKKEDGDFIASLRRIGRDTGTAVAGALEDGQIVSDGISQGVGSLLTAGPIGRGLSAIGRAILPDATRRGVAAAAAIDAAAGNQSVARALTAIGSRVPQSTSTMLAVGLTEGGGAYQQTVQEAMEQLKNRNDLTADQKTELANQAGLVAAGIQTPLAAITGAIAAKFEGNPLGARTFREILSNIGREGIEEYAQSGSGQIAQNLGIRDQINPNQAISEGVGEQAGLGGLYGLGTAGVVQAPAAARNMGVAAVGRATETIKNRSDSVTTANEQASPVADSKVQQAAQTIVEATPSAIQEAIEAVNSSDLAPEQKQEINEYVSTLADSLAMDPSEFEGMPAATASAIGDAANRVDALHRMAQFVVNEENSPQDRMQVMQDLNGNLTMLDNFIQQNPSALDDLPANHPAKLLAQGVQELISIMGQTPTMQRVTPAMDELVNTAEQTGVTAPVTDNNVLTEDGQRNVQNHITIAEYAPEKANLEAISQILKHDRNGTIMLSSAQRTALQTAAGILNAAREYDANAQAQGLKPQDIVSKQIKTDENRNQQGQYSALQHAKRIRAAYTAGNLDLARNYLTDFGMFVQHMQNKVGALNEHLLTGNNDKQLSVKYQSLQADRSWKESRNGLGVTTTDARSVNFAKQVGLESDMLTNLFNSLTDAFPDLNIPHMAFTPLNPLLSEGTAAQIVDEFSKDVRSVNESVSQDTVTEPEIQQETVIPEVSQETVLPVENVQETQQDIAETTATKYPNLVSGKSGNKFVEAFSLPKVATTHTINEASPIAYIREQLASAALNSPNHTASSKIVRSYTKYLNSSNAIIGNLQKQLDAWATRTNKAKQQAGQSFIDGLTDANTYLQGKVLNLTEVSNGKLVYNPQLIESAVLAALQWAINFNNNANFLDAEKISKKTGIPEANINDELMEAFNTGITQIDAVSSLAQKIRQYWGLRGNADAKLGYVEGIPLAIAGELMEAMSDPSVGLFNIETFRVNMSDFTVDSSTTGEIRDFNRITLNNGDESLLNPESDIFSYPDAIESGVMVEPESTFYFGSEVKMPISRTQLNNPWVEITAQQRKAIRNVQAQPYYFHMPMVNLYQSLGEEAVIELLGEGDLSGKESLMNKNYLETLKGRNLSIQSAYRQLNLMTAAAQNHADTVGIDIADVEHHFAHAMTSVNRLQMLGKQNPQSSKLMREAVLPTWATLDMTQKTNYDHFMLAVAQMLGEKVHNQSLEKSVQVAEDLLADQHQEAVAMMQDYHRNGILPANAIAILKQGFNGNKLSPMELQAISEYARLLNAADTDLTAFRTPMYLEADGMTNGAINAMALMTSGEFTPEQLQNLGRGGFTVGGDASSTANNHRQFIDQKDTYQATVDQLTGIMSRLRNHIKNNQPVATQLGHVQQIMSMFMSKDVSLNDRGDLELKRGVTKNPLTVTLYGSGIDGIAGKITKQIIDGIYEQLSKASIAMSEDKTLTLETAMFPGQPEKYRQYQESIDALISNITTRRDDRYEVVPNPLSDNPSKSLQEFTFTGKEIANIQANLRTLFVEPMRWAIDRTVGASTMNNTTLVRQGTQAISIYLQDAFRNAVQDRIQWNVNNVTGYKTTEFLSQTELNEIRKSLYELSPFVETGTQNFFIAGSQNTEVINTNYARNLSGKFSTPAFVYGPSDAGVSGVPFINIGMGDGQMVQNAATSSKAPKNVLYVFDGMNMAIDRIIQDSQTVNEAVYDSWQGNPLRAVLTSLDRMMPHVESAYPAESHAALLRAVSNEYLGDAEDVSHQTVIDLIQQLRENISNAADSIDRRHAVVDKINVAVDQMAAAGSPYVSTGKIQIDGTLEEKAKQLNDLMGINVVKAEPTKAIKAVSVTDKVTGAKVISQRALNALFKDATPAQKRMYQMLNRTLPKNTFKVVTGNAPQIRNYMESNGYMLGDQAYSNTVSGFYHNASKEIMIMDATPEVVLHEMIHAATLSNMFEVLSGNNTGTLTDIHREAVDRLTSLKHQFMSIDTKGFTPQQQSEIQFARSEINRYELENSVEGKTFALNEFIAWTLANKDIESALRNTKVVSFAQLAKDVITFLKQLVFGRKRIPEQPGQDMFSNISFNTAILLTAAPTVKEQSVNTVAYQNRYYGDSERIQNIISVLDTTVTNYTNANPDLTITSQRKTELSNALMAGNKILGSVTAHGFPMTAQQAKAFSTIVASLQTQAVIDPNAMTRLQELFSHVTKNLTPDHFMPSTYSDYDVEYYYAVEKFNTVMGNYRIEFDAQGRSSLLPMFFGLATVSDELRAILRTMSLPKGERNEDGNLDALLENAGQNAIDALSRKVSGEQGNNIQDAIDALTNQIVDIAQGDENFIDQYASTAGGYIDRANQYMVNALDTLSTRVFDAADSIKQKTSNKYVGGIASAAKVMAAIATEKKGALVAEGIMAAMNRFRGMHPWFDIVNDMVGRTESNANVYDMIKAVRAIVQQDRQQFRQHLPTIIADKFSRPLTDNEWKVLHRGIGKADIVSLRNSFDNETIRELLANYTNIDTAIATLEADITTIDKAHSALYISKMKQLAGHMMNGTYGENLLRNAEAISRLLGEPKQKGFIPKNADFVRQVDQLVTLYALKNLNLDEMTSLISLVRDEPEGFDFAMSYMVGQRVEEQRKVQLSDVAKFNNYKGYIPSEAQPSVSLIVADDTEYDRLSKMSYIRVGNYAGSTKEANKVKRSYYFAPVSGRAIYNQGIMQNIRQTANGVDTGTGYTVGLTAGIIADPIQVKKILARRNSGEVGENLLPVYNAIGAVVAYERTLDPKHTARLNHDQHFARNVGIWRGRQVEEVRSGALNRVLIDSLYAMYERDLAQSASNADMYINVMTTDDKVMQDAVRLFTPEVQDYIQSKFGNEFMVRRDMLNDALGYRDASVGDAWTGNSRWSDATLNLAKNVAISIYGNDAYKALVNSERFIQNLMRDARQMIIVKSIVVPVSNALGNIYQLVSRGVPMLNIARQMPRKLAEINSYVKSRINQVGLEAELRATTNLVDQRKLKTEIQSITDSHRRMSIWPLIEAGEFSAINDASLDENDIELASGRLYSYIENKVNQLPKAVRDAGRYALITQDTPLFKALEKSVEYGDFISKAILYDDLVIRQKRDPAYALSRITEEYVNYDRLPGRFRSYAEKMGLLWFYNFKIRSAKVAMSMLRNNPLHALLGAMLPKPTLFGTIGSPITDNIFTVAADGRIDYSIGVGQAFRAPLLNPWVNIMSN